MYKEKMHIYTYFYQIFYTYFYQIYFAMENEKPSFHETLMVALAAIVMTFFFLKIVFF